MAALSIWNQECLLGNVNCRRQFKKIRNKEIMKYAWQVRLRRTKRNTINQEQQKIVRLLWDQGDNVWCEAIVTKVLNEYSHLYSRKRT